jgi:hypothetical protein
MTDRELLEAAAKAAGFSSPYEAMQSIGKPVSLYSEWNPLNDDGDALRLAVKLNLTVLCPGIARDEEGQLSFVDETTVADPYASTRRAIVKAAAAIGADL